MADNEKYQKILSKTAGMEANKDIKEAIEAVGGSVSKTADSGYMSVGATAPTGGGGSLFTRPVDYRPEYASPDRWSYPQDIPTLNRYFRLFYQSDPTVGSIIDIYCEMPLSEYTITGEGVEGEPKQVLEEMCNNLQLLSLMNAIMVEFLVVGEAIPHLLYDKNNGIWTEWNLFKPEDVEVIDSYLIGTVPYLILKPQSEEVKLLRKLKEVAEEIGSEIPGNAYIDEVLQSQRVVLENLNTTYIPRLLHAYNNRGTSILSRLWRTFMYEDAIFNTTLQTAKRHSSPLKSVSIGDLTTGFLPSDGQISSLMQSLAQAEADPQAWVFVPPGTKFEAFGTNDRAFSIRNEYDTIEKLKLMALGVSKDFVAGSSTFASAQASLQVFLSRLLNFRTFIEELFIYPKFFEPIVLVNKWEKPSKADVNHRVKTQKGRTFLKPKITWEKALKAQVDDELLKTYSTLTKDFDIKISERTVCRAAGVNWEDELRKNLEEARIKGVMEKFEKDKQASDSRDRGSNSFGSDFGGGFEPDFSTPPSSPSESDIENISLENAIPEMQISETGEDLTMHASSLGAKPKVLKKDEFLTGSQITNKRNPFIGLGKKEIEKKLSQGITKVKQ